MKTVYCICGLGADERIFSKIKWGDTEVHFLQWLIPEKDEPLAEYALRMSKKIEAGSSFTLIGVSFGGIISTEISKLMPVEKLVLISSIQHYRQLPAWMKAAGSSKLDHLIPNGKLPGKRSLKLIAPIENYFLGAVSKEEKKLVQEYRENINPEYLKWSIHQILNWKNEWIHPHTYHLHGTSDKVFPIRNVTPTHTIQSGRHFMVYHSAEEISEILKNII